VEGAKSFAVSVELNAVPGENLDEVNPGLYIINEGSMGGHAETLLGFGDTAWLEPCAFEGSQGPREFRAVL
jgi:hypothetical protein